MSKNEPATQEGTDAELTDFDTHSDDGEIIVADDDGEILDETDDGDDRPDNCACAPFLGDLPCWPCYRVGFEDPNPNATDE